MWKVDCACEDGVLVAPVCCLDDTSEIAVLVDETDKKASLLNNYVDGTAGVTQDVRDAWDGHDCPPVCSECGQEAHWSRD